MAMREEDVDNVLKVIIVGNGCVGKTSMMVRFVEGKYTDQYKITIGVDFMEKDIYVPRLGQNIRLCCWDTAGQEKFNSLTKRYYQGAGAVVYAFSTTDKASFDAVAQWKKRVEDEVGEICSVLVQNKIDMLSQAEVDNASVEDLAKRLQLKLYRISVKNNLLVNDVFEYLAESYLARGGAAGMGVSPYSDIRDAQFQARPVAAIGAGVEHKSPSQQVAIAAAAATAPAAPVQNPASQNSARNGTIRLEPSKRRTGGRKLMTCSIA